MTYSEFIIAIEEYYGAYKNNFILKTVKEFIQSFEENQLQEIFKEIIKSYSNKYKTPPDIAEIKRMLDASNNKAEQAWIMLFNKSGADDMLITDKVLYNVVATWGSWDNFCLQRDGQYRELTHKDFLKKYNEMSKSSNLLEPEILKGASSILYGSITAIDGNMQNRIPAVIGDKDKARELLNKNKNVQLLEKDIADKLKIK